MFECLEKNFELIEARLLKEDAVQENLEEIGKYVKSCESILTGLVQEINSMPEMEEKSKNLRLFEDIYQDKILYLAENIMVEMENLQNFLVPLASKNEKIQDVIFDIDGVVALLMLLPEEIEKTKCVMLAFLN